MRATLSFAGQEGSTHEDGVGLSEKIVTKPSYNSTNEDGVGVAMKDVRNQDWNRSFMHERLPILGRVPIDLWQTY
ncbi:unnamed protein product [Arabidopsis lyrata]|nr:unnamed protein product [Arabidopsis lyrata]